MKKAILAVIFLLATTSSILADDIIVPFSCYPKEIQKKFHAKGIKIDLNGIDRTPDSWGFIVNEGNQYILRSYHSLKDKDFDIITSVIFGDNYGKKHGK